MLDNEINTSGRRPIEFDHDSSAHARNWSDTYRELREKCPRGWTESHGGYWVATRYKDIMAIAQSKEGFFTGKTIDPETGAVSGGVTIPPLPFRVAPNEIDLPEWREIRNFLNRNFSPEAVEALRPAAQKFAAALVDDVIESGRFDIVDQLASPLPALMTMQIIGFPLERWEIFADVFHKLVYMPKTSPEHAQILGSIEELRKIMDQELEDRRANPKQDLLSYLIYGAHGSPAFSHDRIQEIIYNVLGGGIDTTTALTSNALVYLAGNPAERQRLIDHPEMLPLATEEFVRYFSPIQTLARNAGQDTTVAGWTISGGERVLLAYASANRDPEVFEDAEHLKMDRYPNRHVGFGAGQHRCLGSFLARMMFETMVREVLARMPDYRVDEEKAEAYTSLSTVNGWIRIPATFTPGARVGASITG